MAPRPNLPTPQQDLPVDDATLICHIRPARRKARKPAEIEMLSVLAGLGCQVQSGGPLSEKGGVFWVSLPAASLEAARTRFQRLGYTSGVDTVVPARSQHRSRSRPDLISWRNQLFKLERLYEEDADAARHRAPDRRSFDLEDSSGSVRSIRGYRGGSAPLSRRGLPSDDARILVNLALSQPGSNLLDPFAGIGGIVIEALSSGAMTFSIDVDSTLRVGLMRLGSRHCVADARQLPYRDGSIASIATEPPYHSSAALAVRDALGEFERVLENGGRLAMLCGSAQAPLIGDTANSLGLDEQLDFPIDRKGQPCVLFLWQKE